MKNAVKFDGAGQLVIVQTISEYKTIEKATFALLYINEHYAQRYRLLL